MPHRARGFRRLAWGVLTYAVLVILWGGYVRASGSGAGCGAHWPLCNGAVLPRSPSASTLVELGHRVSSGLLGLAVLGMGVAAFRVYPRGSWVRYGALAVGVLTVVEALIGRGLVRFEYVGMDARIERAYWIAGHLVNTFLLLAAMALTARAAGDGGMPRCRGAGRGAGRRGALGLAALLGLLVLGASGAVTALGDTLALGGLDPAEEPTVAALVGLRLYHPLLACLVVGLFAAAVYRERRRNPGGEAAFSGLVVLALMLVQLGVGLVNVALRAPIPLQLVHLLLTDLIWIGAVLFAAGTLAEPAARRAAPAVVVAP